MRDEVIEALNAIERGEVASVCFGCTPLVDPDMFRSLCSMHKKLLPSASIRPTHGDAAQLAEEVLGGAVDAALVTLPVKYPDLHVEELRRDRLVACLRKDSPLAQKPAVLTEELQENLAILYHPQRHPDAHARLVELLNSAGVKVEEYSRASHPSEMQILVKEGFGIALIREGTPLDGELTTRPIAGVEWTVDTALVYHKKKHPKTIPILARQFKRQFSNGPRETHPAHVRLAVPTTIGRSSDSSHDSNDGPIQMTLPG
jgi:DNA-binding transcriptional LysR family regulator